MYIIAGEDYTAQTVDVHIPAGKAVSTLEVPLIDDVIVEGNEDFSVHLSTADSGLAVSTSAANVTIREDDSKKTSIHTLSHLIYAASKTWTNYWIPFIHFL